MTITSLELDVAILGGGIAGLWTLATLRAAGYSAMLFENRQLGGVQTIASQGIIHGGIKYALTGAATRASKAIAEMPALWRTCLNGGASDPNYHARAELPDLSSVRILSESQYLWTTPGIGSRLMGVAASKAIRTSVERVPLDERPASLRAASEVHSRSSPKFDVYRVAEPVLDVRSVVEALLHASGGPTACVAYDTLQITKAQLRSETNADRRGFGNIESLLLGCWAIDSPTSDESEQPRSPESTNPERKRVGATSLGHTTPLAYARGSLVEKGVVLSDASTPCPVTVLARRYIFTAGAGNEHLLSQAGCDQTKPTGLAMQRRPLHMVMLRATDLPDLFGHCTAMSDKPRITVTTSRDDQGRVVWYVGGLLAEQGVPRDAHLQIACAKKELRECLPWLDWDSREGAFRDVQWATWRVDRAEGLMHDGSRPDEPVVVASGNVIAAWPTKLAFAPLVARKVRLLLEEHGVRPSGVASNVDSVTQFRFPPLAEYPWNRREVPWTT